eukprot:gnl/TRDRNA2_/TRDRNA2_135163_c0_seq1.p1 gnl/TRDRNA2_/TRDRNA2_135163_c0~~gnl/TRDRNA2_/TRDRNA2_135163_c0_seq1.p1  ORF type:complete len:742 (-),score=119.59 gnl/TRDRNA2_/TRDRNA2_135163_c0_seq1:41-2266(-)
MPTQASADSAGPRRSPRQKAAASSPAPRGYYDVLRIPRTATSVEVREAYRRRALATHPDKGGRPEEFRQVVEAFTVLADEAMRAAYNSEIGHKQSRDGDGQCTGGVPRNSVTQAEERAVRWSARRAHMTMMTSEQRTWPDQVSKLEDGALAALHGWVKMCLARNERTRMQAAPDKDIQIVSDKAWLEAIPKNGPGFQCIHTVRPGNYRVEMTWAGMKVLTAVTQSLDLAVKWHIALAHVRSLAQKRLMANQLLRAIHEPDPPPLTSEELIQALRMEPCMHVYFITRVSLKNQRATVGATQDLSIFMHIRNLVLTVLRGTNPVNKLKDTLRSAKDMIVKDRKDREIKDRELGQVICAELLRRAGGDRKQSSASGAPEPREEESMLSLPDEALMALELNDALGLDDEEARQAVRALRTLSAQEIARRRAVIVRSGPSQLKMITDGGESPAMTPRGVPLQQPAAPRESTPVIRTPASSSPKPERGGAARRASAGSSEKTPAASSPASAPAVPRTLPWRRTSAIQPAAASKKTVTNPFAPAGVRSSSPPRMTCFWAPDVDLEKAIAPLQFLSSTALCRFWACSRTTAAAADKVLCDVCCNFEYCDDWFEGTPWTRSGRARVVPKSLLVHRLIRFFTHPRHVELFVRIDLLKAPMTALEGDSLQAALVQMPKLKRVAVPQEGWSAQRERTHFMSLFKKGVVDIVDVTVSSRALFEKDIPKTPDGRNRRAKKMQLAEDLEPAVKFLE